MATMQIEVVSAEAQIYSGTAEMVIAPAFKGEIGVLPRHTPMLARIKPGVVRIKAPSESQEIHVYVSGGMLEIQPHIVTVLADTAVRSEDLDEAKAIEAKRLAEEMLENSKGSLDYAKANAELAMAIAQIQAIHKLRKRGN